MVVGDVGLGVYGRFGLSGTSGMPVTGMWVMLFIGVSRLSLPPGEGKTVQVETALAYGGGGDEGGVRGIVCMNVCVCVRMCVCVPLPDPAEGEWIVVSGLGVKLFGVCVRVSV